MWALNKGDWPWLLLGLLGAIIAGGATPSEGVFIAHVQVHTAPRHMQQGNAYFLCVAHSRF